MLSKLRKYNFELLCWTAAVIALAFSDPTTHHFTLCPLSLLGFDFCPGCGLGHSIAWLFRGEIAQSFDAHPLGIFALGVIGYRIVQLSLPLIKPYITNTNYQP